MKTTSEINDLFAKDLEEITKDERATLVEHYDAERKRFDELERAGKSIRGTKAKAKPEASPAPQADTDLSTLLDVKVTT